MQERQHTSDERAVVALAGRRIDLDGTDSPRFPLDNVPIVRSKLASLFREERVAALVCSAACGADLIALEEAERLDIRRRVILPWPPERFRMSSVVDRPGNWGLVFNHIIAVAKATGELVIIGDRGREVDAAYAAVNQAIIREAQAVRNEMNASYRLVCVIVWEGAARPGNDVTAAFHHLASNSGFEERFVLTSSNLVGEKQPIL